MEPTSKQSDQRPRQNSFIRELNGSDTKFSGISGIARKKTNHNSEFMARFQDKQSFMNKDGHMGVVANAQQPIVRRVDRVELSQHFVKASAKVSKLPHDHAGMKNSRTPLNNNANADHFASQGAADSRFSATPSHNHIAKPAHLSNLHDLNRIDSGISYESSPAKHYSRKLRENSPTFGQMLPLAGADVMPGSDMMLSKGSDNKRSWHEKRNSDPISMSPSAQGQQQRFKQSGIQQSLDVAGSRTSAKAVSKVERRVSHLNGAPRALKEPLSSQTTVKKVAKSAQRSTNFIRAGNSISGQQDTGLKLSASNNRL